MRWRGTWVAIAFLWVELAPCWVWAQGPPQSGPVPMSTRELDALKRFGVWPIFGRVTSLCRN